MRQASNVVPLFAANPLPKPEKKNAAAPAQVWAVFDAWRLWHEHPRAQLDNKRAHVIAQALRWNYTVDDLVLAVIGNRYSDWHQGANDRATVFADLALILRSADHIDRFMRLGEAAITITRRTAPASEAPRAMPTEAERERMQAHRDQLMALVRRGRK